MDAFFIAKIIQHCSFERVLLNRISRRCVVIDKAPNGKNFRRCYERYSKPGESPDPSRSRSNRTISPFFSISRRLTCIVFDSKAQIVHR